MDPTNSQPKLFGPQVLPHYQRSQSLPDQLHRQWSPHTTALGLIPLTAPLHKSEQNPYDNTLVQSSTESVYPSPPSTSSEPNRSVPLPTFLGPVESVTNLNDNLRKYLYHNPHSFGGILDSPLVIPHGFLKAQMPLSPPPTQPTSTLSLPLIENGSLHQEAKSSSPSYQYAPQSILPLSPTPISPLSLFSRSSVSTEGDASDLMSDPLLSPLSPEWESNHISIVSSPTSYLFSNDSCRIPPISDSLGLQPNLGFDSPGNATPSEGSSTFSSNVQGARPILPPLDIPRSTSPYSPSPSTSLWIAGAEETLSPTYTGSTIEDEEYDDSMVSPPSSGPPETPASPQLVLDDIDDKVESRQHSDEDFRYFPHPSSPSIRSLDLLPCLDEEYDPSRSPSSPLLRSFTTLPELNLSEESPHLHLNDPFGFQDHHRDTSPLSSPFFNREGSILTEEPESMVLEDGSAGHSPDNGLMLLLDEDPADLPLPRSPSPDNFNLDPAMIAGIPEHFEVQKLAELRRKSQLAEKAAKQKEQAAIIEMHTVLDHGASPVPTSAESNVHDGSLEHASDPGPSTWELQRVASEARRIARKEREKSKEVSALLRLKLTEKGFDVDRGAYSQPIPKRSLSTTTDDHTPGVATASPDTIPSSDSSAVPVSVPENDSLPPPGPPSPPQASTSTQVSGTFRKKSKVPSIAQLVAKMIINRHDSTSTRPPSSKYRSLWLKGLSVANGTTRYQPNLPYQQHYKFLRSSPLARNSISATPPSQPNEELEDVEMNSLDDLDFSEDIDGGFEALKTPLRWGMDLDEVGAGSELLPAL